MSVKTAIGKIFGMFDKVDDIVYEPLHLLCDCLRQPLKQIDAHNEKVKAEHDQELEKQLKQFEVDLEVDKKRREMELSADQRRIDEEINQMILDSELQRDLKFREDMVQLEIKYRKEMSEAAAQFAQIMANIQVDARSKIIQLYTEKEKEYLELQDKSKKQVIDSVKNLREMLPDGSGEDIVREEISTQFRAIAERSAAFSKLMNEDMRNVFGIIDAGMKDITGLATKYFKPSDSNQQALTQNVVDLIEKK